MVHCLALDCTRLHCDLQCIAVYCTVLQCVTMCYNVLHCCALWCIVLPCNTARVAVWCSMLQCVAVCCSVLQCVAVWWGTWTRSSNCDRRSFFRTLSCAHNHALPLTFSSLLDVSHSPSTLPSLFVYFSFCMSVFRSLSLL